MPTTLHRFRPTAIIMAAVLGMSRALRPLIRRMPRRRAAPLAGLSDHVLQDIGLEPRGALPLRLVDQQDDIRGRRRDHAASAVKRVA